MNASAYQILTVVFQDPTLNPGQKSRLYTLDPAISFSYAGSSIPILSDNSLTPGSDVTGLLYTPDLDPKDRCYNLSQPYVLNATRQGSLPNRDSDLIGIAPWISKECTFSFLQSAYNDPINGFMFYVPGNSTNGPAPASDPQWDLGDNGDWKKTYKFPVFAIPGPVGALLMHESALYSGNLTNVPNGNILAAAWDPRDYVRLYVDIGIAPSSNLPSLWVFLLIVLCILLFIIFATSISMHCLQRRRRQALRRRVVNGEIDLEALGIQRMTVPQHILDGMPMFEYGSGKSLREDDVKAAAQGKSDHNVHISPVEATQHSPSSSSAAPPPSAAATNFENHVNQTTCAICLDDFQEATQNTPGSPVRQLPCHHIFHPECVDSFLRENSSLCPMCKHSALPLGYCPRNITNAMVRRERIIRRMRERADAGETSDEPYSTRPVGFTYSGWLRQTFTRRRASPSSHGHAMAEMTQPQTEHIASAPDPAEGGNRREWARQRALAMLGRRPLVAEEQTEHPSRWRKVMGGVFPGIA